MSEDYEVRLRRQMIEIFGPFERFNIQLLVPSTNASFSPFQQKDSSRSNSPTTFLMLQNMQNLVDKSPIQPPITSRATSFEIEAQTSNIKSPLNPPTKLSKGNQLSENEKPLRKGISDLDEITPIPSKKPRNDVLKETNLQKREKDGKISSSKSMKSDPQKASEVIVSTEKILEVLTYLPPILTPPRRFKERKASPKEIKASPKEIKVSLSVNNVKKEELPEKPSEMAKERKREEPIMEKEMKKEFEIKKEIGEEASSSKEISSEVFVPPNVDRISEKIRSRNGEKRTLREENMSPSFSQLEKKRKHNSEAIGNLNLGLLEKNQFKVIEASLNRKMLKRGASIAAPTAAPTPPPPPPPPSSSSSIPSTLSPLPPPKPLVSSKKPLTRDPPKIYKAVDENGVQDMDIAGSSPEKEDEEPPKKNETPKSTSSKVNVEKMTPKKSSPNKKPKPKQPTECCADRCIPSQATEPDPAQPGMTAEEFYSKRARDIKHKGDGQQNGNKVERMLYYLECIAYYVMAARHCETDEQRHSFLRSTSSFVKAIAKHTLTLPSHFQARITHLLKRVEAVQLYQLYATRSVQVVRNMQIVHQLEKSVDEKPNGVVNDSGSNENPPTNPPSTSESKEIVIPKTLYTLHKQQLKTLSYLMTAQEVWEGSKKENSEEISKLQKTMETVTGHRIELDMPLESMARVILTSTSWLREERKREEARDSRSTPKI
ncbi:unnamed protein product, partial [Mesorhabditis belari]|uniref:Protein lilliputian n=1 Tax=Mesorhabditis belari TaxID=2138241 RepID=A0AAF3FJ56_9BILA